MFNETFPNWEGNQWALWESLCLVPPVRLALLNVNMPSDLAQLAQVILATSVGVPPVPHVATYLIGQTLDFSQPKIKNKIISWNIAEEAIQRIPRKTTTLEELKSAGFRLVGTSPNEGVNALDYHWGERDIAVIGGDKGLSAKNRALLDEMVRIPCGPEVPFLTIPTVVPLLTWPVLQQRGLWKSGNFVSGSL
jgi:hypothetical protein